MIFIELTKEHKQHPKEALTQFCDRFGFAYPVYHTEKSIDEEFFASFVMVQQKGKEIHSPIFTGYRKIESERKAAYYLFLQLLGAQSTLLRRILEPHVNAIADVNKFVSVLKLEKPKFVFREQEGQTFDCEVNVFNETFVSNATSKKKAKHLAFQQVLRKLKSQIK